MAITAQETTEKYRLLSGSHTINRVTYRSGVGDNDILELTREQAKSLGKNRVRKLSEREEDDNSGLNSVDPEEDESGQHSGNLNTNLVK